MIEDIYLGFSCDEPLEKIGGLAIMVGMMTLRESAFIVEYEIRDTVLGIVKTKPRRIEFKFNEIANCKYEKTWFKSNFHIKTNVFLSAKGFHNANGTDLSFQIKKKDATTAQEMAAAINARIAENLMNKYDNM